LWFAATDAAGRILEVGGVSQHGALASCSGCHAARASDGYLFGVPLNEQQPFIGTAMTPPARDAGPMIIDAGTRAIDAGMPVVDAGAQPVDASVRIPDAGAPRIDAGTPVLDAGISVVDAGHAAVDSGVSMPDAGVVPSINLTGFTLKNLESSLVTPQVFTFGNTNILRGEIVVLARNASQAEFQQYWGVTLAPNVKYVNAQVATGHDAPTINGGEMWGLYTPAGAIVDGLTVSGIVPASSCWLGGAKRVIGKPWSAGSRSKYSWTSNHRVERCHR
jgi:hypothetical protein